MAIDWEKSDREQYLVSTLVGGKVHNRNGLVHHRFNGLRLSPKPRERWAEPNFERAMLRHEDWVLHPEKYEQRSPSTSIPSPSSGGASHSAPQHCTFYDLISAFEASNTFKELGHSNQKNFDRAFNFFIQRRIDIIRGEEYRQANFDAIYQQLEERNRATLDHNTKAKYLETLCRFFDVYAIPHGWLAKNPVRILGLLKREKRKKIIVILTEEDVDLIVKHLFDKRESRDYGLAVRTLFRMAIRPGEFIHVWREDIGGDEGMRIIEKGWLELITPKYLPPEHRTRNGIAKHHRDWLIQAGEVSVRHFPIDMVPGLRADLDELLTIPQPLGTRRHRPDNYLLRWTEYSKIRDAFNDAVKHLQEGKKLSYKGKVELYDLRASGLHWWTYTLLWPPPARLAAAGHEGSTNRASYRQNPSAEEIKTLINSPSA